MSNFFFIFYETCPIILIQCDTTVNISLLLWIIVLCPHLPSQLRNLELIFLYETKQMPTTVLQVTPTYFTSIFTLPSSLSDEIEKMMNYFLLGHSGSQIKAYIGYAWDKHFMHITD